MKSTDITFSQIAEKTLPKRSHTGKFRNHWASARV